jgi:hypothetical protein
MSTIFPRREGQEPEDLIRTCGREAATAPSKSVSGVRDISLWVFDPGNMWRNSVRKWSSKPLKRQKVPVPGDVGNFRWSATRE